MKYHFQYKDPLGLIVLLLVYAAMGVAKVLIYYTIASPSITGIVPVNVGDVIELIIFELLWIMMFWSHSSTMCRDPGFIPKNYYYDTGKLPEKFQIKDEIRQENPSLLIN